MRERHLKRLYSQALQQWRRGVIDGERTAPKADEPELRERLRTRLGPHKTALDLAYRKGREYAGRAGNWDMPTEVWSLVLAEAQRR